MCPQLLHIIASSSKSAGAARLSSQVRAIQNWLESEATDDAMGATADSLANGIDVAKLRAVLHETREELQRQELLLVTLGGEVHAVK